MKINGSLAIAIIAFCLQGCDARQDVDLNAVTSKLVLGPIINGEKCLENENTSAVAILVEAEIDFGPFGSTYTTSFICSGTLIAPDVVLSAAHCFDKDYLTLGIGTIKERTYYVTLEEDLIYLEVEQSPLLPRHSIRASAFVQHSEFKIDRPMVPGPAEYRDIALLFLTKPMSTKPAILITKEESQQITKGNFATITGWGRRHVEELEPLRSVYENNVKYCASTVINEVGEFEMQIGSDEFSPKKCFGDSGGPTYMTVLTPNGPENRLIGVSSHAYDDADCLKGGIDTRIDPYIDWISEQMRLRCESGLIQCH